MDKKGFVQDQDYNWNYQLFPAFVFLNQQKLYFFLQVCLVVLGFFGQDLCQWKVWSTLKNFVWLLVIFTGQFLRKVSEILRAKK